MSAGRLVDLQARAARVGWTVAAGDRIYAVGPLSDVPRWAPSLDVVEDLISEQERRPTYWPLRAGEPITPAMTA